VLFSQQGPSLVAFALQHWADKGGRLDKVVEKELYAALMISGLEQWSVKGVRLTVP
jgi:hypothetical protein